MTNGPIRVGWARFNCSPGYQIGSDENSWAFDGYNVYTYLCLIYFKLQDYFFIKQFSLLEKLYY